MSKGELANKTDLVEAFGCSDEDDICKIILEKGELQVSEKERKRQIQVLYREIISLIVNKTINLETQRPYPITVLENYVEQLHFSVNIHKKAKQQALELLKILKDKIPIESAKMKIRIQIPIYESENFETLLASLNCHVEDQQIENAFKNYICLIEPGKFRIVNNLVLNFTQSKNALTVLNVNNQDSEIEILE